MVCQYHIHVKEVDKLRKNTNLPMSINDKEKLKDSYSHSKKKKEGFFARRKKNKKVGPNLEQYQQFVLEWINLLPEDQVKMIRGVFALSHTCVREIMIPLSEMMAVHIATSTEQLKAMVCDTGYSFIPVYEERIDRLTGIVSVMDILYSEDEHEDLNSLVRSAYYVPETKPVCELLDELRTAEEQIALVIDEYGSCVGLVTLEDILEQIVGEIGYERTIHEIEATGDKSWIIGAKTSIDEVNDAIGTHIPKDRYDTIGGFLLKMIGHLPEQGEKIKYDEKEFTVAEISDYGISVIHINIAKPMLPSPQSKRKK